MAKDKFYLNCPYDEKDEAKALGAWWDSSKKKWYVPAGMDETPFEQWFPEGKKASKSSDAHQGRAFSDFAFEQLNDADGCLCLLVQAATAIGDIDVS